MIESRHTSRGARAGLATFVALLGTVASGCPGDGMLVPDAGETMDTGPRADGGPGGDDGGPGPCTSAGECDDGAFCNGAERCAPGTTGADARGCAPAADPRCTTDQRCDEGMERCVALSCEGAAADSDGDGERSTDCGGSDCDDADANRAPGRLEVCDAMDRDEDCDATTFGFRDADGDGAADAACCNTEPGGAMHCGVDCNDTAPGVRPGAVETCNGVDDNCDGTLDEGVLNTYTIDGDADGFGEAGGTTTTACFRPPGYADAATDCDDGSASVHPAAVEICDPAPDGGMPIDENCDGAANPPTLCMCTVGESRRCASAGVCAAGMQDCATGAWGACSILPTTEICNYLDDDCNATVDDMLQVQCFADLDNDGYAADGATAIGRCSVSGRDSVGGCPPYYTNRMPFGGDIDCDDAGAAVSPGAMETCDDPAAPADEDCSGIADEGVAQTCYADGDGDGYALSGASPIARCIDGSRPDGCPFGYTARAPASSATTDCNDTALASRPGGVEACDGVLDENCDGQVDEGCDCTPPGAMRTCPQPGVCATGTQTCVAGAWGACSVGASAETCNMLDDNCNGAADEGVAQDCYVDSDNDRFAPAGATASVRCIDGTRPGGCPDGYTERAPSSGAFVDCNDTAPSAHPGASEICEGALDENCSGAIDEGCSCVNGAVRPCPLPGVCGAGTETCGAGSWGACSVAPAPEVCDGEDDDCDGTVDDGVGQLCYTDGDGDGYATFGTAGQLRCIDTGRPDGCPAGTTARMPSTLATADCNDTAAAAHPGGTEVCDGALDENCSGAVDEGCACVNGAVRSCPQPGICAGGTQTCTGGTWGTCSISPAPEVCNTLDDNCNAAVDEGVTTTCWADPDGDSFALAAATQISICGLCGVGYTSRAPSSAASRDCDETRASVNGAASEICDGRDTDCSSGAATALPGEDADGDGHTAIGYPACTGGYPKDDCQDGDATVFPGQMTYFPSGYCPSGSGWCPDCNRCVTSSGICASSCSGTVAVTFDYDCSGTTSRAPSGTNSCVGSGLCFGFPGCDTPHYYYTGSPACGVSTTYWPCGCSGLDCISGPATTRGMACR